MKERWLLRKRDMPCSELSKATGLDETIISILANRGIKDEDEIKRFFEADLKNLHDPFLMKDMDKGTDIIKSAISGGKSIVVYGDYDADGVTSTVILYKALLECGAKATFYIPDREFEGYGMNSDRIRLLKEEGAEVVITCDNGISALEQVKYGKELGLTIVITDHHEVPFVEDENGERNYVIPEADAVINPKRKDCSYPFKLLCGAAIAYKFSTALFLKMNMDMSKLNEYVQYAGIGTICDVVDLIGENRIIAKNALELLSNTENTGLDALMEVLDIKGKKISSGTIGFQIGPCINATGRLDTAALSVELLLCENRERAKELAVTLSELNRKRQQMTIKNVEEIIEQVESTDLINDKVLVIYKQGVHESIAGIVAGKVKEKFNTPTIVLTSGKEMPKGSGRSIEDYNMFEELIKCKHLLEKFGGHPMAAGLSIKEENIEPLRLELNKNCTLKEEDKIPIVRIDKRVPLSSISYNLIEQLHRLEPFGKGNETPVLAEKNVLVDKIYILGKDSNTLKLNLIMDKAGRKIDGICFGRVDDFKDMLKEGYGDNYMDILNNYNFSRDKILIDIIFYPSINSYNGVESIQLRLLGFRLS